ncbi:integral membrane family protein [Purpureocillium lavendulum]|uniref:Poly [ADP-ribose] polymerase n=1 Tax=Purpureocillium lavendulum TaxID=1247861 RepID=A0AB34FGR1_9HYPO|nr:integral membrane family protein [Purpureocillium lavendulum]
MADPSWVAAWSAGDSATSCRIKKLPLEVLIRIASELATTDLCSFRLTCRTIERLLYVTFTDEFFTRKQFMIAAISLQALIDISKSRLGPHLRHLLIGLDRFPDNFQRPLPDDDKERKFRQRYADHFTFWNTGCHRDMLVEAFRNLPNLETVVIRDFNSRRRSRDGARAEWSSYGAPTIFDETGIRLNQAMLATSWTSNTNFQFSSQVFALVIQALGAANVPNVKGIEVMAKNGNQLRDFAFNVPSFNEATILPVLQRLERLHLSINLGWRAQSSPWTQVAAAAPDTMLRGFLCHCTNLKNLRINECHDSPTAMTDLLTWLAGDPNPVSNGSKSGDGRATGPAPPAMDKLEDLSLGWMSVPVAPLIKMLRKFAPTLRGLELWKMTLVMPFPPGSDPSDPPRVMFWTDFMNQLRQTPGLNLRHIKLGALKQAYLHRPEHHVSFKNRGIEAQYTGQHWKDFVDEVTPLLDVKWPRKLTPESEHSDDDDDDDIVEEVSVLDEDESEDLDGMDLAALVEDFAPGTMPPAAELLIQELMAQAQEEHDAFLGVDGYGFEADFPASSAILPIPSAAQRALHMPTRSSSRSAAAAAKQQAQAQPAAPPLDGCVLSFCGKFTPWGHTQTSFEALVRTLGGRPMKTVTKDATHLVCTQYDFIYHDDGKVGKATKSGVKVVQPEWLLECEKQNKLVSADDYVWTMAKATAGPAPSKAGSALPSVNGSAGKRANDDDDGDDDDDKSAAVKPQTKKQKASGKANGKTNGKTTAVKDEAEVKEEKVVAEGQFMKKKGLTIPLDEYCQLASYQVYVDPDSGMIYDASLNQSSTSNNHNKFYRLQILRENPSGTFKTWTRWGRVGEAGQNAVLGNGSFQDALKNFEKKFKDKSGLQWDKRGEDPKPGKYAFVERSYNDDDSDEEMDDADNKATVKTEDGDEAAVPDCTLPKPVQDLMELIFNQKYFQETMASLNYDANKLPLGKLSKATILRGFQQLKDLAALVDDPTLARSKWDMTVAAATEHLSNTYYSLIPHAFGRNRPPVINSDPQLKKEIELLESLSDMKDAADLLKIDRSNRSAQDVHALDRQFQSLGMEEMTPLAHESSEFGYLRNYLTGMHGSTHGHIRYRVQNIFRIERRGEALRLEESKFAGIPSDKRLLWHGSRVTNFGGILSQGLRIAPPEAPVSGYMFGKGIYLADMSSKSAGYCCSYNSNGHALLLLCEAELGDPLQRLTHSSYTAGESAAQNGMWSTLGMGDTAPAKWMDAGVVHESLKGIRMPDPSATATGTNIPNTSLLYNEYICYDVAQVKLRYLFHVML